MRSVVTFMYNMLSWCINEPQSTISRVPTFQPLQKFHYVSRTENLSNFSFFPERSELYIRNINIGDYLSNLIVLFNSVSSLMKTIKYIYCLYSIAEKIHQLCHQAIQHISDNITSISSVSFNFSIQPQYKV